MKAGVSIYSQTRFGAKGEHFIIRETGLTALSALDPFTGTLLRSAQKAEKVMISMTNRG